MQSGDLIDLDITDVAHGGVFVGRHEGRVVFVPDAIPGERVRVRLTDTAKASFWRAELVDVTVASPHRRPHVWRQADVDMPPEQRPGGADFGHIELGHQRALKRHVLTDALQRFAGVDVPVSMQGALPLVPDAGVPAAQTAESPDGTGWRTRVSLHVGPDGRVGPFAARSHRVVAVDDYPLATAAVERAARRRGSGVPARPGRIDLVQPTDGRVRVIPRPDGRRELPPEARETIVERVGTREFRVDAGGFWQVHRLAAWTLSTAVTGVLRDLAADGVAGDGAPVLDPDAWHLDLYGGVGLFAAALADTGGVRVTSVEADAAATEHAGANLAEWVGARAETERVDRWLAGLSRSASPAERERLRRGVVVLDPPRSGAGGEVSAAIAGLEPAAVVYVACDPVALARDLKTFRERGYAASRVDAYDLFPHSHHLEAVAVLVPV